MADADQPAAAPPPPKAPKKKKKAPLPRNRGKAALAGLGSVSSLSSLAAFYYVYVAFSNLANLMYPLRSLAKGVLENTPDEKMVYPLWEGGGDAAAALGLRVYLSSEAQFNLGFFEQNDRFGADAGGADGADVRAGTSFLLWAEDDARAATAAFPSRSFVLLAGDDDDPAASCAADGEGTCSAAAREVQTSVDYAHQWLADSIEHEKQLQEDGGGLMAAMNSAGGGIESTSVLLTCYTSLTRNLAYLRDGVVHAVTGRGQASTAAAAGAGPKEDAVAEPKTVVRISPDNPVWRSIMAEGVAYVHVLLVRQVPSGQQGRDLLSSAPDPAAAGQRLQQLHSRHNVLFGQVGMVKRELPLHVPSPKRLLYRDILFVLKKYLVCRVTDDGSCGDLVPPWHVAHHQTQAHEEYAVARRQKKEGVQYPYWKPEVSVHLIRDDDGYPIDLSNRVGFDVVPVWKGQRPSGRSHPSGHAYLPAVHVDEMGLTSDKYVPLNGTVTALPLRIGFHGGAAAAGGDGAAAAGGLNPARYRLLNHLSQSLEKQADLGFEQSDIDDLRRMIAETNVVLLAVTILASVFHLLFEFLTFKSDVDFWRGNTDLTGLSVRALFLDWLSQLVILFYLIEMDSSLLMTLPTGVGMLIALWKFQRGTGLKFVKSGDTANEGRAWYNKVFGVCGYELCATRLRSAASSSAATSPAAADEPAKPDLAALTEEMDQLATRLLGKYFLLPLVVSFGVYSLTQEHHAGWYSWFITTASSFVYAIGFVLMTPQLFLNYKLKSVAHLPWRVLGYRFVNTFIDDLFAFIIRMPTMARVSCFRDDVVFVVYLWQRYLYPVDASRPVEGGAVGDVSAEAEGSQRGKKKKKQS